MIEDCNQMSYKLLPLVQNDQTLKEMTRKMANEWNNLKDQLCGVKCKMNRLLDLWTSVDSMKSEIENWVHVANEDVQSVIKEGFQNLELTNNHLDNLKVTGILHL